MTTIVFDQSQPRIAAFTSESSEPIARKIIGDALEISKQRNKDKGRSPWRKGISVESKISRLIPQLQSMEHDPRVVAAFSFGKASPLRSLFLSAFMPSVPVFNVVSSNQEQDARTLFFNRETSPVAASPSFILGNLADEGISKSIDKLVYGIYQNFNENSSIEVRVSSHYDEASSHDLSQKVIGYLRADSLPLKIHYHLLQEKKKELFETPDSSVALDMDGNTPFPLYISFDKQFNPAARKYVGLAAPVTISPIIAADTTLRMIARSSHPKAAAVQTLLRENIAEHTEQLYLDVAKNKQATKKTISFFETLVNRVRETSL